MTVTRLHGTIMRDDVIVAMWEGVPVGSPDGPEDKQFTYSCQFAEVGYVSGEYEVELVPTWSVGRQAASIIIAGWSEHGHAT